MFVLRATPPPTRMVFKKLKMVSTRVTILKRKMKIARKAELKKLRHWKKSIKESLEERKKVLKNRRLKKEMEKMLESCLGT